MKNLIASVALALPLVASAATNLLSNGSFEAESGISITSWTVAAPGNLFPPRVIPPESNFGTTFTANPGLGISPDAPGTNALYFVDDLAPSVVFQTIPFLTAGTYFVGFDYFIPTNGANNAIDALLTASFGPTFTTVPLTSSSTAGTWVNVGTTVTVGSGAFTFSFAYEPGLGVPAKDIIVDRAYVVAVPEPSTYGMLLAGLVAVGLFARRRSQQA